MAATPKATPRFWPAGPPDPAAPPGQLRQLVLKGHMRNVQRARERARLGSDVARAWCNGCT